MYRPAFAAILALSAACATVGNHPLPVPGTGAETSVLCVKYTGANGALKVYVDRHRLMTVEPGRQECKAIRGDNRAVQLYAETIGGGLLGPTRVAESLQFGPHPCFLWSVHDGIGGGLDLVPCRDGGAATAAVAAQDPNGWILIHERHLGAASCKVNPVAFIRLDVLVSDEAAAVIAHELDHLAFYRRFPNCAAFQAWATASPRNRMLVEASGHCAAVRADVRSGRLTWARAMRMHAARLAYAYPFGLTALQAEHEIGRYCTSQEVVP